MVGILYLRANALNAAPLFHECACPQSNGDVKAVAGKMIFSSNKKPTFGGLFIGDYSLRSLPYTSRPLTLLIVFSTAAEAAIISRSSPPR